MKKPVLTVDYNSPVSASRIYASKINKLPFPLSWKSFTSSYIMYLAFGLKGLSTITLSSPWSKVIGLKSGIVGIAEKSP